MNCASWTRRSTCWRYQSPPPLRCRSNLLLQSPEYSAPKSRYHTQGRLNLSQCYIFGVAQLVSNSNAASLLVSSSYPYIRGSHVHVMAAQYSAQSHVQIASGRFCVDSKPSCPLQHQGDTGDARGLYQGSDPKRGGGAGGGRKSGALRMPLVSLLRSAFYV